MPSSDSAEGRPPRCGAPATVSPIGSSPVTYYCAPATAAPFSPLNMFFRPPHTAWNPFPDTLSMADSFSSSFTSQLHCHLLRDGGYPRLLANVVPSCHVSLCPTAPFSFHSACHCLQLLWFVCPTLHGPGGFPRKQVLRRNWGFIGGETPMKEKGRKQVQAGGVIGI